LLTNNNCSLVVVEPFAHLIDIFDQLCRLLSTLTDRFRFRFSLLLSFCFVIWINVFSSTYDYIIYVDSARFWLYSRSAALHHHRCRRQTTFVWHSSQQAHSIKNKTINNSITKTPPSAPQKKTRTTSSSNVVANTASFGSRRKRTGRM
jgi:hypothetical protein